MKEHKERRAHRFVPKTNLDKTIKVLQSNGLSPNEIKVYPDGTVIFVTVIGGSIGTSAMPEGTISVTDDDAQSAFDGWRQRREA
ncbi:hypothetical protein H8B08_14200 [Caulobacter sp. 17J80-11]|nr:hypothetical protein [Caulobacter sp. 17J80-11]